MVGSRFIDGEPMVTKWLVDGYITEFTLMVKKSEAYMADHQFSWLQPCSFWLLLHCLAAGYPVVSCHYSIIKDIIQG